MNLKQFHVPCLHLSVTETAIATITIKYVHITVVNNALDKLDV